MASTKILRIGRYPARGVFFLLVLIHWILPFTPVNPHPELRIKVVSIILGAAFLWIGIKSISQPSRYFITGFILLLALFAVSALSGASPITEGLVVKVFFAFLIALGILSARRTDDPDAA